MIPDILDRLGFYRYADYLDQTVNNFQPNPKKKRKPNDLYMQIYMLGHHLRQLRNEFDESGQQDDIEEEKPQDLPIIPPGSTLNMQYNSNAPVDINSGSNSVTNMDIK